MTRYFAIFAFILMSMCFCLTAGHAQPFSIQDRVHQFELQNGLTVLLMQRKSSPTISFAMSFRTGAVDEKGGTTGVAHLLEHMLFKGTRTTGTRDFKAEKKLLDRIDQVAERLDAQRRLGPQADAAAVQQLSAQLKELQDQANDLIIPNEFDAIYTRNGAEGLNAGTGYDFTVYTVSLPENRLELWMRMEADRFANPVFRQFYSERDVVIEEMRQSYETNPERLLSTQLLAAAFQAHPYGRPIIGWKSDIEFLPRAVCEEFFKNRYSLANAVAAVVGDIDIAETRGLFERYFARIPARRVELPFVTREPAQSGERRVQVRYDAEPVIMIGYHKPSLPSREDAAFELIDAVLSNGRTSRLYKSLVVNKKIASSIDVANGFPGDRFPNLFYIRAVPLKGVDCAVVEKAIYSEIERLAQGPITEQELAKAKKQFRADYLRSLDSNRKLSHSLSYYQIVCNDWRFIEKNLAIIDSVTVAEIKAAIKKYLVPDNRTVATLMKDRI